MSTFDAARPPHVLCVEDDPDSAAFIRTLLAAEGHELELCTTGDACREAVGRRAPDLVLLDLTLPDGSGLDVLRALHRDHPRLPVIVVTASTSTQDAIASIKLGAVDFLSKPVDPKRLSLAVHTALQLRRQEEELERLRIETEEASSKVRIDEVLEQLVLKGGSDLHLKVGRPPMMRISGELAPSEYPVVDEGDMERILRKIFGRQGFLALQHEYEYDASYLIEGVARFRVNGFKRMGQYGAAFRVIPLSTPTIDLMNLPAVLKEIVKAPQGMVLVTGPTGSGKSTTLAAMVEQLNESQPLHIVTIEDPVEFVYTDKKCTLSQRQLGSDVKSLKEALRRALRQDPDVILMGEMRDMETIELAMHAAETGHLVFSTLHTNDAKQTLDRIVDAFPPESAHQVRAMLALTLQAVISQRLVKKADGTGRVAAVEIMVNSPNIRELIAEGKTASIEKAMTTSGDYYRMQTFNQALARLVQSKAITEEEAAGASTNPGDLRLLLKGVTSGSAFATTAAAPPPGPTAEPKSSQRTPTVAPPSGGLKISRGF